MLFGIKMKINVPHGADQCKIAKLSDSEKSRVRDLRRAGKWKHIWRIAGSWANISILDVDSTEELHEIITSLPLFPYMELEIIPLAVHPASHPN